MEHSPESEMTESRRRAALAISIVDQLSGPRTQIFAFTDKNPILAVATAFTCGAMLAALLRR